MKYSDFSALYGVQEILVHEKRAILHSWVTEEECAAILQRHMIDPDFFLEQYATKVFDYFMGVVSGTVELGKCPIMADFIDYLKDQEIRSDELFLICTYFKRSMINATYRLNIHTQELFVTISHLFDMNFSGVLRLYTDTIYQKEREAIEAGQAKEYFLSNMSHEIRTPLNAILGFVHLLKSEHLGEKVEKYLDIIAQSGENLLHIINDILDFSKMRSGEFSIHRHPFNLHEQMGNTLELFIPNAVLKSISLEYKIHPDIPLCVCADSFRIQQIVGNLLSNAIKFSEPGKKILVNVDIENTLLWIRVRDFGAGIAPEDQERVFDPFYQATEGTMHMGIGGSGLGLSICKQLAHQMGGELTLESALGEGSLFVVSLPIELRPDELCEIKKVEEQLYFQGEVLIAEDNEANQELIKMVLERMGIVCVIVSDGRAAVEAMKATPFDLIIMDEQMPIMNGNDAVKEIRSYEKANSLKPIPIIALSANIRLRNEALSLGYDTFIGKPFSHHDLVSVLGRYLIQGEGVAPILQRGPHVERLQQILGLEAEQIQTLLELFHRKMGELLESLHVVLEKREYQSARGIAHTIKGSSANFRFKELSDTAAKIEEFASRKNKKAVELYSVLLNEYEKIKGC